MEEGRDRASQGKREKKAKKEKKKLLTAIENFETYRLIDLLHDIALHQSIYYPVSPAQ